MAVKGEDLIAPNGPVEPELFEGESEENNRALNIRVAAYVKAGVAKVAGITFVDQAAKDEAVTAWALYLTFRAAYTLTLTRPAEDDSQIGVMGSVTFDRDQREGVKELRDTYFADYQVLIADTGLTSAASTGVPSYQTTNLFDW